MRPQPLHLLLVLLVIPLAASHAYDHPGPTDYPALHRASDLVVEAEVIDVTPPARITSPTKVTLRVRQVLKGERKKESLLTIYHDSSRSEPRRFLFFPAPRGVSRFRCPPLPRLEPGESVRLYLRWDAKKKHFILPGARCKVLLPS